MQRYLDQSGPFVTILIMVFVFGGIYGIWHLLDTGQDPISVALGLSFLLFMRHQRQTDAAFLSNLNIPIYTIRLVEYGLVTFPFLLLFAKFQSLSAVLVAVFAVATIPLLPEKHLSFSLPVPSWLVPIKMFEWRTGFRKAGIPLLVLLAVGFALITKPYVTLFFWWACFIVIINFYEACESREMVQAQTKFNSNFLNRKIKQHLKQYWRLFTIPLIIYSGIHPEHWWVVLLFAANASLSLAATVVLKYAYYYPNANGAVNPIYNSLILLSFVIPFLLPVPLAMTAYNYSLAKANVKRFV